MEIDRKELKWQARERIRGAKPPFWAVALVYFLLTTGVSLALDLIAALLDGSGEELSTAGLFLSLLALLYGLVAAFGIKLWSLWTWRRLGPGLGSLVQGFSVAGKVLIMELQIILRSVPWAFLLSAAVTLPVLLFASSDPRLIPALALTLYGCMTAGTWVIMLRWSLAPYLLADRPDDGPSAAVRRSARLMRGWTWELFKLEFSFAGWVILSAVLSGAGTGLFLLRSGAFLPGVGAEQFAALLQSAVYSLPSQLLSSLAVLPVFLWLTPYREAARAGFYDERQKLFREELSAELPPL